MNTKMPKYIELYSQLKQEIVQGTWPVGSFLPTENEIMELYQVSKTTVRHAVKLLRDSALVEVRQGSGTRVLPIKQETIGGEKYKNPHSSTSVLVSYMTSGEGEVSNTQTIGDVIPASETVAAALGLAIGAPVCRLQRLQLADGIAFGYMVNYLSADTFPDLLSKGDFAIDLYGRLKTHYNVDVTEINETLDSICAGFMEAQYLQVRAGTPLLLLKRIASGPRGIVEYCETVVRPDIFHMSIKVSIDEPETTVNPIVAGWEAL